MQWRTLRSATNFRYRAYVSILESDAFVQKELKLPPIAKIYYDEIIFVRGEATNAEHTKRYVSILESDAFVQKELIRIDF